MIFFIDRQQTASGKANYIACMLEFSDSDGFLKYEIQTTLREYIFEEDIFAKRGSLSCEFRGRYFREIRIEGQFREKYFRDLKGQHIIFRCYY